MEHKETDRPAKPSIVSGPSSPSSPSRPRPIVAGADAPASEDAARTQDRRQAFRRATFLALSLAAIALSIRAVVGERGLLEAHRSRSELARLQTDVEKWKERNTLLEDRIRALREDPATVESIARERLGWIRPGEITFLFPYDSAAPDPSDPGPVPPGEFSPAIGEETDEAASDGSSSEPDPEP